MSSTKKRRTNIPKDTDEFKHWLDSKYDIADPNLNLIADLSKLTHRIRTTNESKLRALYQLGAKFKGLNKEETRRLCASLGINGYLTKIALKLQEKFKDEEELVDFLYNEASGRITKVIKHLFKIVTIGAETETITNFIQATNKLINRYYTLSESEKKQANAVFKRLAAYFPLKDFLDDKYFLKYSRCAACGADASEVELILKPWVELPGMSIPICQKCQNENKEIDYKILATIYGLYAFNVEEAYNKIHYGNSL